MDRAVIFLGPSLPQAEARALLDADYRPPVRRGDVDALCRDAPCVIGIVDGEFFQSLAVSPKEILRSLRAGCTVFGASSMGALRAVELQRYGMIGVGTVFELYRSGRVDGDDEVALVFSADDQRALSMPLVNLRVALAAASREGLLSAGELRFLLRRLKALYFPERTHAATVRIARERLPEERCRALATYLGEKAPDAKRDDAVALLRRVRAHLEGKEV